MNPRPPINLIVKILKNAAPVLCDETGNLLPNQRASVLEAGVGERSRITVTFEIDGKLVKSERQD